MNSLTRPCGNQECSVTTLIDEVSLSFGSGDCDNNGFWENPCAICAAAHLKKYPAAKVYPLIKLPDSIWKEF